MSKQLIRVLTQYYDENGRPKMGQEFELKADSDYFMYAEKEAVEAIKKMLLEKSRKENVRYEYIEHEVIFGEPEILDSEEFEIEIHKLLEKTHEEKKEV